jgi:type VI secretion system protein ImpM
MSGADTLVSTQLPGWFGKLPGSGDFAARRLPESARLQLDDWLQKGLQRLRGRHSDWTARYLESPLWCFLLGENIIGPARWLGVLMPSVDAVGRYFPLIVAVPCDPEDGPQPSPWFSRVSAAALDGLERDLDAVRFDAALAARWSPQAAGC